MLSSPPVQPDSSQSKPPHPNSTDQPNPTQPTNPPNPPQPTPLTPHRNPHTPRHPQPTHTSPQPTQTQPSSPQAVEYIKRLPKAASVPFTKLFPNASEPAIDLLGKMLQFDPRKRIRHSCRARDGVRFVFGQGYGVRGVVCERSDGVGKSNG